MVLFYESNKYRKTLVEVYIMYKIVRSTPRLEFHTKPHLFVFVAV